MLSCAIDRRSPGLSFAQRDGMLMLDRYLVARGRALDLATGAPIRWHVRRPSSRSLTLFSERGAWWLIDMDVRGHSRVKVWERPSLGPIEHDPPCGLEALRAALGDARDGRPRAIDLEPSTALDWSRAVRVLAREARLTGFVPIAAEAIGGILAQSNWRWPGWIKDRSLVLFTSGEALSPEATLALFRLATRDARPHVIVRGGIGEPLASPRFVVAPVSVHETAPQAFGEPEESHETAPSDAIDAPELLPPRAGQLLETGRVADAEACARWGVLLSAPGLARNAAQCALARCLIRQHRTLEARAALAYIPGEEAEALRHEIAAIEIAGRPQPDMTESFVEILRVCQEIEDESLALTRVAVLLRERLSAASTAFVVRENQSLRTIAHAGAAGPLPAGRVFASRGNENGVLAA